ncbi:MAG: hypothetical protein LW710_09060 [Burkholderiales bacterium]|uniref:hypothetical protein n=1 Tax=Limnobacter sp. TaxID=2003368 RepID=UPI0039BC4523|nr:hypothetical protein [Burkholderiales bacterium]
MEIPPKATADAAAAAELELELELEELELDDVTTGAGVDTTGVVTGVVEPFFELPFLELPPEDLDFPPET